jgi:protein-disulfide isomerase
MTINNNDWEKVSQDVEVKKEKGGYEIEVQESMPRRSSDKFLPISIIVAAVLICGAIVFSVFYRPGSSGAPAPAPAAGVQAQPASAASLMTLGSRDEILGNAGAPVTIVEYGDYQCPFCTRYFSQIQPTIKSQYLDTGKAKMVFRDFPFLGPESLAAANAAQCAEDQGKLWNYHDALYTAKISDEAQNANAENDGFFTRAEFLKLAGQVGLNQQTFASCLDGNQHANDVAAEKAAAVAAGVGSTPTTVVNGKMVTEPDGSGAGADPTAVFGAINSAVSGK